MRKFGKRTPLDEAVREIQWPNLASGCTIAELGSWLSKQGVHTKLCKIPHGTEVDWPWPVIAHVSGNDIYASHFVVLLPSVSSPPGSMNVWDGAFGIQSDPGRYHKVMSGNLLLTSSQPISEKDIDENLVVHSHHRLLSWAGSLMLALGTSLVVIRFRQHRKKEGPDEIT